MSISVLLRHHAPAKIASVFILSKIYNRVVITIEFYVRFMVKVRVIIMPV